MTSAAMKSPPEKFAFVPAILVGTKSKHPDYLATVDVEAIRARAYHVVLDANHIGGLGVPDAPLVESDSDRPRPRTPICDERG